MPSIPWLCPPGPPIGSFFSSGISVTMTSVVSIKPATLAAFCNAQRDTFVGSMIPALIMSTYSSVAALKPALGFLSSRNFPTTTEPSIPALAAI